MQLYQHIILLSTYESKVKTNLFCFIAINIRLAFHIGLPGQEPPNPGHFTYTFFTSILLLFFFHLKKRFYLVPQSKNFQELNFENFSIFLIRDTTQDNQSSPGQSRLNRDVWQPYFHICQICYISLQKQCESTSEIMLNTHLIMLYDSF